MPTFHIGASGLNDTFQEPFPRTTPCVKCQQTARIAFVLAENDRAAEYLYQLHKNDPQGDGYWLHDAAVFATYICTDIACGVATTLYNQA